MELNQNETRELTEDFSFESFIDYSNYNSDDPDFDWHKNDSTNEVPSKKAFKKSSERHNSRSAERSLQNESYHSDESDEKSHKKDIKNFVHSRRVFMKSSERHNSSSIEGSSQDNNADDEVKVNDSDRYDIQSYKKNLKNEVEKKSSKRYNLSSGEGSSHYNNLDDSQYSDSRNRSLCSLNIENDPRIVDGFSYNEFLPSQSFYQHSIPSTSYVPNNNVLTSTPMVSVPYRASQMNYTPSKGGYFQYGTNEGVPSYHGYQLLGDSQLLRFSKQMLSIKIIEDGNKRYHGYCVSGQKIQDLLDNLLQQQHILSKRVVLLIGTNDFVQNNNYESMCESYNSIVKFLLDKEVEHIVLVTVPPIPRFHKRIVAPYWYKFRNFNKFIADLSKPPHISVVDLAQILVGYDNSSIHQYFEECYTPEREDLLHLNAKGFTILKTLLDIHVFNDYC